MGAEGAILGLVVHFSLMAVMAAALMIVVRARPELLRKPVLTGLGYGLITYAILDLLIVPLRFPAAFPPKPMSIATQLFAHLVLVGLIFAFVARRWMKSPASASLRDA